MKELFAKEPPFDNPKPTNLIARIIQIVCNQDDTILDFFAGSGTTGQAVMKENLKDRWGTRKFILVQLPEKISDSTDFSNISDITKERIRRAAEKYKTDESLITENIDLGFRVFKLDESNFKGWNQETISKENIEEQLELHVDHLRHERRSEDILYEILLKSEFFLSLQKLKRKGSAKKPFTVLRAGCL